MSDNMFDPSKDFLGCDDDDSELKVRGALRHLARWAQEHVVLVIGIPSLGYRLMDGGGEAVVKWGDKLDLTADQLALPQDDGSGAGARPITAKER